MECLLTVVPVVGLGFEAGRQGQLLLFAEGMCGIESPKGIRENTFQKLKFSRVSVDWYECTNEGYHTRSTGCLTDDTNQVAFENELRSA